MTETTRVHHNEMGDDDRKRPVCIKMRWGMMMTETARLHHNVMGMMMTETTRVHYNEMGDDDDRNSPFASQ